MFNSLLLRGGSLPGTSKKSIMLPKIVLTFHCLNKLFLWSQKFCKFSAFSLEFQKFFSITRTIFSHSRSEQFWKQNTIYASAFSRDFSLIFYYLLRYINLVGITYFMWYNCFSNISWSCRYIGIVMFLHIFSPIVFLASRLG